jgi:hypothetical protein
VSYLFPEIPTTAQRASGPSNLRYEDVCQDGRLTLVSLPHVLGDVVWRRIMVDHPVRRAAMESGIVPIMTRYALEGGDGPLSVASTLTGNGAVEMAHTVDADGRVGRLLLNAWAEVEAPPGRTYGPPPDLNAPRVRVGRVYAEHVLTRLFAPAAERKVLAVDVGGKPFVPEARWAWRTPEAVLALPDDAEAIDAEPVADATHVAFGLDHTDSNQHVNSRVYPQLFIDAAVRRLADRGVSMKTLLARRLEVAYRKPFFAGDRARIVLRAFRAGSGFGAVGAYVPDGGTLDRPSVTLHVDFGP